MTPERVNEIKAQYGNVWQFNENVAMAYIDGNGGSYDLFLNGAYQKTVRTLDQARDFAKANNK
ncbi:MAG: hypothetical protein ACMV1K_13160 [Sulfurospirillum sp.]